MLGEVGLEWVRLGEFRLGYVRLGFIWMAVICFILSPNIGWFMVYAVRCTAR